MANLMEATTNQQFEDFLTKAGKCLTVVHFQAAWAPQCGQMNEVMAELAKEHADTTFVKLEAEAVPEVSEKYDIASVPTFLFFKGGEKVDRLDGANAPELTKKVQRLAVTGSPGGAAESTTTDLNQRLKKLINAAPCMLFMKGSSQEPRCGFSRQIVGLLKEHSIQFSSFDILSDEEVRQGLKTYSNWPTYPQLYVNGELVGGLDIVKELAESGELENTCPKAVTLEHRLKTIINQSPVMLFMKGNKDAAKCGFSRQTLEILNSTGVDYDTFDILQDEEVRQLNGVLEPDSTQVHMVSAGLAGFTAITATNPIWLIKTRLQLETRTRGERRMNAFDCVRRVYQMDGLRGFYRGMSASYAGISETVIHFVIYESIKRKLMESKAHASMDEEDESVKDPSDFVGMMLAAATSKTCATSIAYPHEVIRTRLREEGSKYRSFFRTLLTVPREEGYRALYRGLTTHLVRQIPNTAIMMCTYEVVVYLLGR